EGMFSSVKTGIASLTQEVDGFFLLPVDNPIIQKETLFKLYETFNLGKFGIVYPSFQGERGHPPLISCRYTDQILSWNGDGGLKRLLEYYQADSVDVETGDPGVLMDMDTPEDYQKMLEYVGCVSLPREDECYELLRVNSTPAKVIEHCKQVAWLSCFLGRQLVQAGCALNLELLKAAALLHDIAKGKANHAQAGAKIMHKYPQIADIIASHMDITLEADQALSEKEIVYLADKLVANDQIIPLQERFKVALERYRNEPEIREKVRQRFDNGVVIQARMEQVLKKHIINLCRLELRRDANG
ncbi:DVU_1551 family NTP transferase, partial [Desulfosporosinus sp.]|uniref:DVU_1551 family NTP transferase n=1 Tax=Desulfosporosinus sp. TaxID=157907 RepID=UPI002636D938